MKLLKSFVAAAKREGKRQAKKRKTERRLTQLQEMKVYREAATGTVMYTHARAPNVH